MIVACMSAEQPTILEQIRLKDLSLSTVSFVFFIHIINPKVNFDNFLEMTEQEKVEYEKLKASGLQDVVDDEEKKVVKKEQEKKAKDEKKK